MFTAIMVAKGSCTTSGGHPQQRIYQALTPPPPPPPTPLYTELVSITTCSNFLPSTYNAQTTLHRAGGCEGHTWPSGVAGPGLGGALVNFVTQCQVEINDAKAASVKTSCGPTLASPGCKIES